MANSNDSLIQLIKDLTYQQQDDTDPSNILIQQFQSPYEQNRIDESATITKWALLSAWSGLGYNDTFHWNQGGQYAQTMEVYKCLMLI